ncbi:hypothetical protein L1049_012700 [Liquidambar formosana]|uniref:Uncharacterized protein n=1 Tax=Liquidambar formosana TaxID=63359 RepID=A0AAP0WX83_LIQFO
MAAKFSSYLFHNILLILVVTFSIQSGATHDDKKVYIVYMGSLPEGEYSPLSHHLSVLQEVAEGGKIIGARSYFLDQGGSTRDNVGHGSHTASIAAGNKVLGASFYGLAQGNARGGVPSARIAVYRPCKPGIGCPDDKVLKAFDDAIADGVDIITISIGGDARNFTHDSIAIGAFHAMDKGMLTVQSAGNDGPRPSSISSVAPWILSVAASTTDRQIIDKVVLGNGTMLIGKSVNSFTLNGTNFPLIYGKDVTSNCKSSSSNRKIMVENLKLGICVAFRVCKEGCLDSFLVKGKVVLCNQFFSGVEEAFKAGALGVIALNSKYGDVSFVVPLPASTLSILGLEVVKSYINSTILPQANIMKSEATKVSDAPVVHSFSSRGPNSIAPEILKPDISAPGIDILAAFSPVASVTRSLNDNRSVKYNILSGTSMSCPHAAGAAAYVKSFHPDWSTPAIKSALMTTEYSFYSKLIGARYYSLKPGENSARDKEGHGTHTASTAVGNIVKDVSFYGLAQGTVRGGVPSARIATYKVCNPKSLCDYADILAAFDDAIADGVDIITVSLGTEVAFVFNCDPISIGAFHAMEKGTLTVNGAGNGGPAPGSTGSVAPWVLTVAASSIDRRIIDKIVLGNGTTLTGNSVNSFALNGTKFPLTYFDTSLCGGWQARVCREGCLNSSVVKGRIVLCDIPMGKSEAYRAGAIGSVLKVGDIVDASFVVPLPAVVLSGEDYNLVRSYFFRTELAEATILKSEDVKDVAAPVPGEFSSRGPNSIVPDIMKPDVTAPGIEILAAFSPIAPPSRDPQDRRSVKYSILSGTSVSGPHAAGAAAYVKTFHPDWSPSAIKSALMTTGNISTKRFYDEFAIGEFAYGSGHINPIKAVDPGLVYEAYKEDYIKLLCSTGYDEKSLRLISGDNSSCPKEKELARDFNYPSMTVEVPANISFNVSFHRTVTNVGIPNSTYRAKVLPNPKMKVEVVPSILSFKSLNEKKSFAVTVAGGGVPQYEMVSASLVWSDGTHSVRTPIVVSCLSGCLDSNLVKGKIVLCDDVLGGEEAFRAGALGSIVRNGFSGPPSISPLPASDLAVGNYNLVKSYFNSTKRPQGTILKSEATKDLLAPVVASFSSRGPNGITPDILKPDVTAPGVNILAAFSPVVSPSDNPDDKRSVKYSILSGTSMSCPHVAAAAAYVKTFHPDWSPSAIKSALLTTDTLVSSSLVWSTGTHNVRSPVIVYTNTILGENLKAV